MTRFTSPSPPDPREEERLLQLFQDLHGYGLENEPPAAAPSDPRCRVGGHYVLLAKIGAGGGGSVWRAWDETLRRPCAVKILHPRDLDDRRRLLREAQLASRLTHPAIARVYEAGPHGEDGLFIAMELVEGRRLDQADLAPRAAARAVEDVARALQHAHEQGILHRDVTPGNILVDALGRGRLIDFGLARRVEPGGTTTAPDVVLGTPAYLAPETVAGGPPTPAADLYGLAASLWAALTGRPPYPGKDALEVLHRAVWGPPPPRLRALRPDIDPALEAIVEKAMAREPARRYASAAEMADDLTRFREGRPPVAPLLTPARRLAGWVRRRSRRLVALGGLLAAAAAGAGILGWTERDRERRRLEAEPRLQAGREALERAERLLALPEADLRPLDRYLDGAVEALGEALDRDPARPEGYALLGRVLFLRERPEEAERELSRAIERVPTNPAWRLHRAEVREALAGRARSAALIRGRPVPSPEEEAWRRRAVEDLREAERLSLEEGDRLVAGARRALLEGDRAAALERAARGLQVDPNRWEFYFVRAVAAPPGPEAVSAWRAAWQRRPNDGTIVSEFSAALEGTRREEDLREALAHVSRLAERNPGDLQRRADRLRLLRKLLRFREALEEAEALVRAAPEAIHPRYQRGQLYLLLDDTARGIADLERCLEVIPPEVTGWEYYNDLARAYARAGRWADAARCLEEAYRRNGDRGDRQVDANLGLTWAEAPWEESVRQGPLRRVRDPERGLEVRVGIATAWLMRALYPDPAERGADLASGPAFQALAVRRLYLGDFDGACSTVPERHLDPSVPEGRPGFLFRALARSCRGPRGAYEARPEDFPEALMAERDRWAWGARLGRGLAGILWGHREAVARDLEEALRLDPERRAETLLALSVWESARGDKEVARGLLREAAGRAAELAFLAAGP